MHKRRHELRRAAKRARRARKPKPPSDKQLAQEANTRLNAAGLTPEARARRKAFRGISESP